MSDDDVLEWLEVAQHDIDTVRLLIDANGHSDIIIYHIHQTVEKLIKAILVRCNASFEKAIGLINCLITPLHIIPI